MADNLKNKVVSGISWSLLGQVTNQLLTFIISIVLARLLGPEAFGLIGLVMGITTVLNVIQDFGLGSAIIQKSGVNKKDFSSIFLFNLGIGIILFIFLFFTSGLFADFFKDNQLEFLFQLSAVGLIFGSMSSSLGSLIRKDLDFKKLTMIGVFVNVVSGGLGLYLAYDGFGVLSLVIRNLVSAGLTTIIYWVVSPLKPSLYFSLNKVKGYLKFGANMLGINFVARIFEQIDVLIIGRFYNPASVGFYNRAKSMKVLPLLTITSVLNKVLFPVYSKIKHDENRLKKYFSFSIGLLSIVYVPIMLLLAFYSKEVILLLLTDEWAETIPYLQILCITGFFMPISSVSNNILISRGKSRFSLRYILIKRTIYTITLLIAAPFGIFSFVLVSGAYAGVTGITDLFFASKEINLKISIPLKKIFLQVAYTVVALGLVYVLVYFLKDYYLLNLIFGSIVFGILFIYFNYKSKNEDWIETMVFLNPYIRNIKKKIKVIFVK
ncbi:lipopolysaccharide biosynthesis protein [Winogradskyella sp. 4-2091]|uniref:lipopolysaccharide biosynthesis protein n=1 Tax=Winogradskyella sp. 4-2091 TaxID=3381659 RepID=UPI003891A425